MTGNLCLRRLLAFAAPPTYSEPVLDNNTLENSETVQQSVSLAHGVNQPVERIVSELSDDQLRRMLIDELRP